MRFDPANAISACHSLALFSRPSRKRGLSLALVWALSAGACFGQPYAWTNVTIGGGGFVSGIITHPNAPGVVYARTDIGGAYRWNAAGSSWIPLLDFAADANILGVESIAIDPSDSNRLYVAASRGSPAVLLMSTNQGGSFSQFTPPFSLDGNARGRGGGERMNVDPNLGSILFYGTKNAGLYQSVNFGATWSKVAGFPINTTANTVGTVFVQFIASSGTPGSATPVIFAAVSQTNNNIYRSTDAGVTWSNVPTVVSANFMPHHAAQDGLGNMYITFNDTCGPNDNVATGAVVKLNLMTLASTDVTPPKNPGEQGGWGGVAVDRQHPATVIVSTLDRWYPPPYDQVYRSTDGGATWKTTALSIPPPGDTPWTIARTTHWAEALQLDPFNSDRAWFGTGYGIFSCTNLTASDSNEAVDWEFTSDGIEEMVPLGLASPPSGPSFLLSAHGDQGGFRHYDLDVSPPETNYFATHRVTSYGIDFAENRPADIVRLVSEANYGAYCIDGGTIWHDFATVPPGVSASNPGNIAISADGRRIVWMPSGGSSVAYWSTNLGSTWTASTGGPTGNRAPISDRVNTNKFYIYSSTASRIYVSTNGAVTFSAAASISSSSSSTSPRAVFGVEGDIWLPRGSSGLSHSVDSGTTFTTVAGVTASSFVSFGKAAPGQGYPAVFISGTVGGVAGVYRSDDGGVTWVRINDSQHQYGLASIHTFCADPRVYGRVYFGTEGRGIVYGQFAAVSTVPPLITFASTGNQIQLGWPQDHTGWILQAQTNLPGTGLSTNWGAVAGSTATNLMTLPVDTTDGSVFYRLISP